MITSSDCRGRKSLAPLDLPRNFSSLRALFAYLEIPAEFIEERLHSVTHSFGWHREADERNGDSILVVQKDMLIA